MPQRSSYDICVQVTRRKIPMGTRSDAGRDSRGTVLGIMIGGEDCAPHAAGKVRKRRGGGDFAATIRDCPGSSRVSARRGHRLEEKFEAERDGPEAQ